MRRMKQPVFRSGFTLLELLVVIAIIMLLASILMPAFSNFRRKAKMLQCTANLNQIGRAGGSFAASNQGAITGCWASAETSFGKEDTQTGDNTKRVALSTYTIPGWHRWTSDVNWNTGGGWYKWPNTAKVFNWIGIYSNAKREMGMGCLYTDKYLTTAKSYYCPMNEFGLTSKEPGEEFAGNNGFCKDHAQTWATTAGYTYNPHNLLSRNRMRSYRWHKGPATEPNPWPGNLLTPSEAVWCMDILSPNFYRRYPYFNHSRPNAAAELTDDDLSFNLLHIDGAVSSNVFSPQLMSDARRGAVNFGAGPWDDYIFQMIDNAKSDL